MDHNDDVQNRVRDELERDDVYVFDKYYREYGGPSLGMTSKSSKDKKSYDIYLMRKTDLTINDEHIGHVDVVEVKLSLNKPLLQLLSMAIERALPNIEGPDLKDWKGWEQTNK